MKVFPLGSTCFFVFLTVFSFSQSGGDESLVVSAREQARDLYDRVIYLQAGLYNGKVYEEYDPLEDEHPYFIFDDLVEGSIVYRGDFYSQVPILYDIRTGRVVIEHPQQLFKIELVFENVDEFEIGSHNFVRLEGTAGNQLKEDYYEELYRGNLKVYAHYSKTYFSFFESNEIVKVFNQKVRYYIYKDGKYYEVGSKRSALDILSDHKRKIKAFMREHKIRFNRDKATALYEIAQFYDTQTQQ